jgi:hypothetical protein
VLDFAELGQVSVTYLHEELPALGLGQAARAKRRESCRRARVFLATRTAIVVTAYFRDRWEGINRAARPLPARRRFPELVANRLDRLQ